jgi:shikimate 5-dehydrogenase
MAYVVYNVGTTRVETEKRYGKQVWATEAAAKAARTRMLKKFGYDAAQLAVQSADAYHMFIEQSVERVNLITGATYRESVNTPSCCSPSSESYWSM